MENPQEILNLISKKNVSRILITTYKKPRSAQELNKICGIPIAVCYRIIHRLEELGFLTCIKKQVNRRGKPVKYYSAQIINAQFFYEKGGFKAKIQTASGWEHYPPISIDTLPKKSMQFNM
jgi:DNA-binding Lrp family transcriptional regulator